jgi:tetratricopeptide (TPR) repeat protein
MSAPSGVALDDSWSLHERAASAFNKPLEELRGSVQRAATPPDLVAAADPAHFQRACMLGLAGITDLGLDPSLPEPIREALRGLPPHYQEMLSLLLPAAQAIMAAAPDLRNIQHIEGMAGLLYQATQAANPATTVGVAAIGGATLGTLLMPGIGTAIGGALGVWLGGVNANKRDRRALERFSAAVKLMWTATEDLQNGTWNYLVHAVQKEGHTLPDAAYFETADAKWASLKAATDHVLNPGAPAPFRSAVETYLHDWGPHPEALYIVAHGCLPPYLLDLPSLASCVGRQLKLYPNDPRSDESSARLALEQGEFARALEAAERGLALAPKNERLRQAQVEALAALGRVAMAEEKVRLCRAANPETPPELALICGLLRGGRRDEAVERARAWLHRDGKPALIVDLLRSFPVTAPLLTDGSIPPSDVTTVLPGCAGRLQATVQRHLRADGTNSYYGEPPGEKGRNAREEFLQLQADEKVLYFHDWSLWHNAKTGLAVTTQRLLSKRMWEDTVSLELREVAASPTTVEGPVIRAGGHRIDVENVNLAHALERVLREAGALFTQPTTVGSERRESK